MNNNVRKRTKPDTEQIREELLEAGRVLLAENGGSEQVNIKLSAACRRAGLTSRLAATVWSDQRQYQGDLARFVASGFEWAGPESVQAEMVDIVTTCEDFDDAIRLAAPLYFNYFIANDNFYLALQFWSVREPTAELIAALSKGYDIVHAGFKNMFTGVMMLYGRRLREPYTIDHLTAALTAVTEGMALRHRIQPEVVENRLVACHEQPVSCLFAEATLALAYRFTEQTSGTEAAIDAVHNG